MTRTNPLTNNPSASSDEMALVCDDPTTGQSICFTERDGRQIITYSYPESGKARGTTLTDVEAEELTTWRNSGRRTSFWDWPGWDAVKNRAFNNPS